MIPDVRGSCVGILSVMGRLEFRTDRRGLLVANRLLYSVALVHERSTSSDTECEMTSLRETRRKNKSESPSPPDMGRGRCLHITRTGCSC
jgi:hypothetical protein